MFLLGYDIGSSSIKAALVDAGTGRQLAVVQQPKVEMTITALKPGWAEQHPEEWWKQVCSATRELLAETGIDPGDIKGIGIAYQMHGLVMVDQNGSPVRPSIIWCDSRAVKIGERALKDIGKNQCLSHLLNSPGNFTASKLRWVKENEPENYRSCHKFMLPGDYIAFKLTGEISTTVSGLSEGILWDFKQQKVADMVLDTYELDEKLVADLNPTLSIQGTLTAEAAQFTGLKTGTPVSYRAGDQPNNAMALNVLEPGEIAATGGTSGVVYGIVDQPIYDQQSRVNGFAHVNYNADHQNIGILLCINGSGIQYGWVRNQLTAPGTTYQSLEEEASRVSIGSDGLVVIPFGNGAERMLGNQDIGSQILNLQLNRHHKGHLYRSTLEGIAFSFIYGINILKDMGLNLEVIRVGNDNLFQSGIFSRTISTLSGAHIEMAETTGAVGAALASGVATGIYQDLKEAMSQLQILNTIYPDSETQPYLEAYEKWSMALEKVMSV